MQHRSRAQARIEGEENNVFLPLPFRIVIEAQPSALFNGLDEKNSCDSPDPKSRDSYASNSSVQVSYPSTATEIQDNAARELSNVSQEAITSSPTDVHSPLSSDPSPHN
ncbi:hypothetical protein FGB62_309g02 [Gracilaria domingensis]|nr:hypothetical protein FGB62_309g02 [Gracilaria domingensis]